MITNRSVPTNTVLPHITYQDVAAALEWLTLAFGFVEQYRYGPSAGPVQGAQMRRGDLWIMLARARTGRATPAQLGQSTQSLSIFVDDVQAHFDKARSAGVRIVEDLNETFYGERQYVAVDLDGHHWLFSQHIRDVLPAEWGAREAAPVAAGTDAHSR